MYLFLFNENAFYAYTLQHYTPLLIISILGTITIIYAKDHLKPSSQKLVLLFISLIPFISTFLIYPIALWQSNFDLKEDLPFHICRFLALVSPFVIWKESRFWIGIFYFWILVGTLNATITPDIEFGFPHWSYFAYWMTHGVMIIIPLYYVFVIKVKISFKDFINSYVMMNVFLLLTLSINFLIGSNYMYTREKPPVSSLLDILGPWPLYLISGQLLVILLFGIVYLPFYLQNRTKKAF